MTAFKLKSALLWIYKYVAVSYHTDITQFAKCMNVCADMVVSNSIGTMCVQITQQFLGLRRLSKAGAMLNYGRYLHYNH